MTTDIQPLDTLRGITVELQWQETPLDGALAACRQNIHGVVIVLASSRVDLQSIAHEVCHAVDWLSALGAINGMEERAHFCGAWTEDIVAMFLRAGWVYSTKADGAMWNRDVKVALERT